MASEEELKADAAAAKECLGGNIDTAAQIGNLAALRHLLRADPERLHQSNLYGDTPLHNAARFGQLDAAEFLLSKGAAVDATNNEGDMPLHCAAGSGAVQTAELLLSKGAIVDAANKKCGETPLHTAVRFGQLDTAEFLLSKGAAVDAKNKYGRTPLHYAAANGHVEAAELLLSKGAAVDAKNNDGKTPLDLARERGKTEMEQLLLKASEHSMPVKQDASGGAAGSGAVAVKQQRESSKEAAKELQEAMNAGNAQILKKAIDNAKLHKVNPEDVMTALEKYIALQEAAHQTVASPAKEATSSKAESSVKLEPGYGARLAMFSARFNEKNKDIETKFRAVHKLLVENYYDVLMVEAGAGESFGNMTAEYLHRLQSENGIMLAVCTSDYGEMTDSPFCTYFELKYATEYKIDVLPLQVEKEWKPNPPCGEGHPDTRKSALGFISMVFYPSCVRVDCRSKSVEEIASEIAAVLRKRKPA